jgi:predicted metal-binding protein
MVKKIEKIDLQPKDDKLNEDLKRYREKALELGATKAEIIKASDIPVDERVTLKCQIPRCFGYGVGANCPPNTLKPAELREILNKYKWAIFFIKDVPSHIIVRDRTTIEERVKAYQDVFEIVNAIESMAFYDGHYLAVGFSAGSCRHTFCGKEKTCQAMVGERCRFSLRSRPSMEAVGIDVYRMVTRAGWDIYPIGCNARAEEVEKGTLAGIIIVD